MLLLLLVVREPKLTLCLDFRSVSHGKALSGKIARVRALQVKIYVLLLVLVLECCALAVVGALLPVVGALLTVVGALLALLPVVGALLPVVAILLPVVGALLIMLDLVLVTLALIADYQMNN